MKREELGVKLVAGMQDKKRCMMQDARCRVQGKKRCMMLGSPVVIDILNICVDFFTKY